MPSPKIPTPDNLKMHDAIINKFNVGFAAQLPWLDYVFGKCQILKRNQDKKVITYPAVYAGLNIKGDYQSCLPDETVGNTSFFVIPDPQEIEWKGNTKGIIESKYGLILWFNLEKVLNSSTEYRNIELVKASILNAIRVGNRKFRGEMTVERIYETDKEIFREFSIREIDQQYLIYPFCGLRFEGKIRFFEGEC